MLFKMYLESNTFKLFVILFLVHQYICELTDDVRCQVPVSKLLPNEDHSSRQWHIYCHHH
jgi:hypothetical protein